MKNIIPMLILVLCSCSKGPMDRKISEDDAYKYVDEICTYDSGYKYLCEPIRKRYADILAAKEIGKEGRARIAKHYGKTFEQLTFRDISEK